MVNVSEVLASFRLAVQESIDWAQKHSDMLQNKFKLVMYEGGPAGAGSGSVDDMCIAAHRHPDMRGILAGYYEGMRRNGMVSALVHFVSSGTPSKYGNWGLIEASDQDPRFAPKQQGRNMNHNPNPCQNILIRIRTHTGLFDVIDAHKRCNFSSHDCSGRQQCLGHGACVNPDQCSCYYGFQGRQCEIFEWKDTKACGYRCYFDQGVCRVNATFYTDRYANMYLL